MGGITQKEDPFPWDGMAIYCSNQEQSQKVQELLIEKGVEWRSGGKNIIGLPRFPVVIEVSVYPGMTDFKQVMTYVPSRSIAVRMKRDGDAIVSQDFLEAYGDKKKRKQEFKEVVEAFKAVKQ